MRILLICLLFASSVSLSADTTVKQLPHFISQDGTHVFHFHEDFSLNHGRYRQLFTVLLDANEGTTIRINLKSPGGYMYSGYLILGAINQSDADVYVRVDNYALSMGAILAIHSDNLVLDNNDILMFHAPAAGGIKLLPPFECDKLSPIDKLFCLRDKTIYYSLKNKILSYNSNILTDDEWERYRQGDDIWISGRRICDLWIEDYNGNGCIIRSKIAEER